MEQLKQFVDKAADPVIILGEIDAANNTINEIVEQLNQPQADGKRKSRKKRKTGTKTMNQRGGWMYKESAVSSNYSKRIPSERMPSSRISSKGMRKSSSSKDKSSSSKTRKG